ncbi:REP-associated tyrosine transposase [Oceanobacillus damuensis]|uniref:REP-associated tyrosine transposase n=1 Tax=Oceanobacillus damuensis TaxID=937928 RepID=UPI00082D17AE|nr:transposase [Oceanobacillus damuensis]
MPRNKRLWIPDTYYHITSRGNRREQLFKEEEDYKTFLSILRMIHQKTPFKLASYCLLSNHYHLLMSTTEQPISKVMALVNKRYADYFNTKNNVSGHVFEKRYFDKPIGTAYGLLEVSRYIHLNPVKAGIVERPETYQWSSYRHYYYHSKAALLNKQDILQYLAEDESDQKKKYEEFMNRTDESIILSKV